MSLANFFGHKKKRYWSVFPPDLEDQLPLPEDEAGYQDPLQGPARKLTNLWRVIESSDSGSSYLTVEFYNVNTRLWVPIQTFTSLLSGS